MPKVKKFTISEDDGVVRVDKYLASVLPEYSRAALHRLFDMGFIRKDDRILKPGEKLRPGSTFSADVSILDQKPDVIELPVIYEDENVIVIDKPAGIISHARGRFWQEASVASFVRDKVSHLSGERAGIVHRLDRATSGVMICAKNEMSLKFLQRQFQDRKVVKSYIAVTDKAPKHLEAIIDAPIGRDMNKPKQFHIDPHGKNAVTKYKITPLKNKNFLWELTPETGRTHQLRVHLKYLHCPIIGDELYGGKKAPRLYLHAHKLEIRISLHQKKTFVSKIPQEFYD